VPLDQIGRTGAQIRQQLEALSKKFDDASNKADAPALAALFTQDAVEVGPDGPVYGRKALEKHFSDLFQKVHFSDHISTIDQDSPHIIGTDGKDMRATGRWSLTYQVKGGDPVNERDMLH
jgi:ketosteroid isomerase-like protein